MTTYKTAPPCGHEQTRPAAGCVRCYHWKHNSNGYRERHGGIPSAVVAAVRAAAAPAARPVSLPLRAECVYQGAMVERCQTCGSARRHVYECSHPAGHGRCTRGNPLSGFMTCAACPDWTGVESDG